MTRVPVFTPAPEPRRETGPYDVVDMQRLPKCGACDDVGPVCEEGVVGAGLCRACWRVVVLLASAQASSSG